MIADLGAAGTPGDAREQLETVRDLAVVDEPVVVVPNGVDESMAERTVEALAPEN
jgi:hypothetical protein